jgi:uncharacterized protein (DUF58 family)
LAASVSEVLSRGEHLIDLFAAGPRLHIFRAGRHTAHLENVLEILAGIEPCRREPFLDIASELAEEIGRTSSVVCVFLRWNDARRQLVELATEAGCAVKVLLVTDDSSMPVDVPDHFQLRSCSVEDVETGTLGVL